MIQYLHEYMMDRDTQIKIRQVIFKQKELFRVLNTETGELEGPYLYVNHSTGDDHVFGYDPSIGRLFLVDSALVDRNNQSVEKF